ncbi:MAG: ABC transporter permease [Euryarchaeota archaeon]|nr:ABC transporter permease [Euryarchaeota archaeon]
MAMSDHIRTFRQAAWLGWQIESNWTRPWLFLVYSVVRPIAATLILVIMFLIIKQDVASDPLLFSYMYLGAAFYMFVAQVLFGTASVIHEDREHYQTLRHIYIAPISIYAYIIGRATSKVILTTLSVIITLAFGMGVLGLPLDLLRVDWPLFALTMVLGLACITALGITLAGASLLIAKHSIGINEGIAGTFYLFCGVVFPLTALPAWGQAIGLAIPITYWLEGIRRTLYPGGGIEIIGGLQAYSDLSIMSLLILSTSVFLLLSIAIFRYADRVARKKGKVDMITTY